MQDTFREPRVHEGGDGADNQQAAERLCADEKSADGEGAYHE